MDLFPNDIKRRIISLLPEEEAARTSILSKSWKLAWATRPVLVFDEENHLSTGFANFLYPYLLKFSEQRVPLEELRVNMTSSSQQTQDAVLRWVVFALGENLKTLDLSGEDRSRTGNLLDTLSSTTLTTLNLSGCELTLGPCRRWRLPRLRTLSLSNMILNSAAVQGLVSACPSLEQFEFRHSSRMPSLELSRIGNLKRADVELDKNFRKISLVGAASLESFIASTMNSHRPIVADIELEGCEASLKELRLSNLSLSNEWVRIQISRFPNLKALALECIHGLSALKISSTELTELALVHLPDLGSKAEIYAPNLRKLNLREIPELFNSLGVSRTLESINLRFTFKPVQFDLLKTISYKINDINNVVVSFRCYVPKIVVVHNGFSENLLETLVDLCYSMSKVEVIISSDRNWDDHVLSSGGTNNVYIASPDNNNNNESHLSEHLLKKYGKPRRRYISQPTPYVRPMPMETENNGPKFGGGANTEHALLNVYRRSSFRLTGFALKW